VLAGVACFPSQSHHLSSSVTPLGIEWLILFDMSILCSPLSSKERETSKKHHFSFPSSFRKKRSLYTWECVISGCSVGSSGLVSRKTRRVLGPSPSRAYPIQSSQIKIGGGAHELPCTGALIRLPVLELWKGAGQPQYILVFCVTISLYLPLKVFQSLLFLNKLHVFIAADRLAWFPIFSKKNRSLLTSQPFFCFYFPFACFRFFLRGPPILNALSVPLRVSCYFGDGVRPTTLLLGEHLLRNQ
jgi:hypothetical protein